MREMTWRWSCESKRNENFKIWKILIQEWERNEKVCLGENTKGGAKWPFDKKVCQLSQQKAGTTVQSNGRMILKAIQRPTGLSLLSLGSEFNVQWADWFQRRGCWHAWDLSRSCWHHLKWQAPLPAFGATPGGALPASVKGRHSDHPLQREQVANFGGVFSAFSVGTQSTRAQPWGQGHPYIDFGGWGPGREPWRRQSQLRESKSEELPASLEKCRSEGPTGKRSRSKTGRMVGMDSNAWQPKRLFFEPEDLMLFVPLQFRFIRITPSFLFLPLGLGMSLLCLFHNCVLEALYSYRRVCLRMNYTLSLTRIWFGWYLD